MIEIEIEIDLLLREGKMGKEKGEDLEGSRKLGTQRIFLMCL